MSNHPLGEAHKLGADPRRGFRNELLTFMKCFKVVNFEKYQHYGEARTPPWIKVYNSIFDHYQFSMLKDSEKWHLIAIWLLASRSKNKLPYDGPWIAHKIHAREKVQLSNLESLGFIESYEDASAMLASCYQDASLDKNREEKNKTPHTPHGGSDGFDLFWKMYPKKKSKSRASRAWAKLNPNE